MPRAGQIVPSYLHPHVMSIVNDNTIFQDSVAVPEDGPSVICVFVSGEGEDGVFKRKNSETEFIEEYGYPNFRTDGQPIYNAINVLKTGKASVFAMRIMPDDAAYSNIVLVAKVKKDTDNNKLLIKYEAVSHTSLVAKNTLDSLTDALEESEGVDGYVTIPLIAFRSLGKGSYGDSFAVRFSQSPQADKEYGFKCFRTEVLKVSNGVKQKEVFEGSLFIDAITSSGSKYIEDVFNEPDTGSNKLAVYVVPTALDRIYAMYKEVMPDTTLNDWEFDILFGTTLAGKPIEGLEIETNDNPILSNEGVRLSYGDDGSFGESVDGLGKEDAVNVMYEKAFKGEIDRMILSKRRLPTLVLYDANYSAEVKRALVDLMVKRGDCRLYLDSGLLSTVSEAIEYGKTIHDLSDYRLSKGIHHYITRDPYTGRNMAVTETYFLSRYLTAHILTHGQHIPFTGEIYAKLTGHNKNTLLPVIDVDDSEAKEALYNLQMNYFEAIAENTFVRATQGTAQSEFSDLSEENNSLTTLKVKGLLENLVYSLNYNFATEEDRLRYTEDAKREVDHMQGKELDEIEVDFRMTPWEAERSILHCFCGIKFKGIIKRGIVEIDINKRV